MPWPELIEIELANEDVLACQVATCCRDVIVALSGARCRLKLILGSIFIHRLSRIRYFGCCLIMSEVLRSLWTFILFTF